MKKYEIKHKSMSTQARKLLNFLAKYRKPLSPLLILTHYFPDPDALGSAFALRYFSYQAYGIESNIAYRGEIGRMENKAMMKILEIPARKLNTTDLNKFR